MKALREFFVVILCIALVAITTSLGIILGVKDVFQGAFFGEVAKEMIKVDDNTENAKEINDAIDKLTSYKGTEEVVNSFLEDISKSENDIVISDDTFDLVLKALEDNKEELIKLGASEKEINEAIEEIKKPENRQKMNKEINESVNIETAEQSTGISRNEIKAIKTVTSLVSPTTTKKMFGAIIAIICAIALLTFSPYKWIRPVSISAIFSGFNILACYYAFDFISKMILESGSTVQLDASKLSYFGFPLFFGGIAGVVVYGIINGIAKKNKIDIAEEPVTNPMPEKPTPVFNEKAGFSKFCASCGAGLNAEDKVCGSCGAPLD